MIWMSGIDMGCFYFNQAWLDYRGRTLEQESGNGWAEGVHPDDLDRCVQHYISSFERQLSFAMSYRLQHHSGEYRWILDRGAPHYAADGNFLGFYGGCAETAADATISHATSLREAISRMRDFADRLASAEAPGLKEEVSQASALRKTARRIQLEHLARQNAAEQLQRLATDMLSYDRIANGACLR